MNPKLTNLLWLFALFCAGAIVAVVVILALPQGTASAPCDARPAAHSCGGEV